MSIEVLTSILCVSAVAVGVALLRSLYRQDRDRVDEAWVRNFAIEKYRPMLTILLDADFDFLKNQPGYRPEIADRLYKARRKSFRKYLASLVRDHNRLHSAARELVCQAPNDRSDLAIALLKSHVLFTWRVMLIHVKLALPVPMVQIDSAALLACMDELHACIVPEYLPHAA
jgi:hypothetical protein